MADLENLLLEAAGRTNSSSRNRQSYQSSRKRRDDSYSDNGSDSRDDDSDDDRGYGGRKPSGSQVPLKKRYEPADREDGQGSPRDGDADGYGGLDRRGESSDESDVGSDLYKNEDDRQKLMRMSELEREMILSERADKKADKHMKDTLRKSKGKNEKPAPSPKETPLPAQRVRSSARSADRAAAKDDALNELRAKRLKQQDPEGHRKMMRESSRPGTGGSRGYSPVKRKAFTSASLSSSSEGESDGRSNSEDGGTARGRELIDSDDDGDLPDSEKLKFEDVKEITIRRSKLAKWFMEPFFEDLIVGCFVRVGIGRSKSTRQPIYRLCIVRNVDASDPDRQYKLENKMTYKYLNVVWGSDSSAARWQMAMVSDSPPTEEEFNQLVSEVERTGGRMLSKQDALDKKDAIKKINAFVYSAATVKQMLQEKKSASSRPLNIAAEKDRLRRELEVAQYKEDDVEVERIKQRLQDLEATRQSERADAKAIRLAEMNRKNRVENFRNASELKPVNTDLKAGEAGYDPFSRRWTRSRNYYVAKPGAVGQGAAGAAAETQADKGNSNGPPSVASGKNGSGTVVASEAGVAATNEALEAAAGAGKLVDTSAPVDLGTESHSLHDFDLPISLAALKKFGGAQGAVAAFMARKQKVEATVGCKVPENDGRRHTLTLTVSDYKRRRGLL
ncbi:hypothetical protein MLD38_019254 [Melastoma candidum]|uniref:Uncharacterized protein n=2 Tax=Melastoma candidum TaxID=119954 RepID=A0ACB9R0G2_9MYRT|nr:hypothetical protein MLD38_019254 [Melastoma candidum]